MIAEAQSMLIEATLALTAALLLVFALRLPLRRWLGARVAYGLWCLPPLALLASLLPAPQQAVTVALLAPMANVGPLAVDTVAHASAGFDGAWLVPVWIAGALLLLATLVLRQRRFIARIRPLVAHGERSYRSAGVSGPLLVGHWQPYIVLPIDFEQRYAPEQQSLMLAHERAHLASGDTLASGIAAVLACLAWFNPVAWLALRAFHFDQELACDARVIEASPRARRAYADTMLQTQLAEQHATAPLGCHWPAGHPLKERIQMLTKNLPSPAVRRRGVLMNAALAMLMSLGVWAAQPEQVVATDSDARRFEVRMLLTRPGQAPQMPRLIVREGELSGIRSDDLEVDLKVTGGDDDTLWIASDIRIGGVVAGSPTILVKAGTPGSISIADDPERAFAVTYWVSEHHGDPDSPGAAGERLADVRTPPRYPQAALAERIEGEVVLDIEVDASGVVRDVAVVSATPPGIFDAAAVAAARGWWLNPQNQPPGTLPGRMRAPVKFELDPETPPAG